MISINDSSLKQSNFFCNFLVVNIMKKRSTVTA